MKIEHNKKRMRTGGVAVMLTSTNSTRGSAGCAGATIRSGDVVGADVGPLLALLLQYFDCFDFSFVGLDVAVVGLLVGAFDFPDLLFFSTQKSLVAGL